MKKILFLAIFLTACIGGYFGYQHHKSQELVQRAVPIIKEGSLRTKAVTDFLTETSNANFIEVFSTTDETVKKISELIIQLESINSSANPEAITAAVDYLKSAQTLTRSINSLARLLLEASNAKTESEDSLNEINSDNPYIRKFARDRHDKAIERLKTAGIQINKKNIEMNNNINYFKNFHKEASKYFPIDSLLPYKSIDGLEAKFPNTNQ